MPNGSSAPEPTTRARAPHRCSECGQFMTKVENQDQLYSCFRCGNKEVIQLRNENTPLIFPTFEKEPERLVSPSATIPLYDKDMENQLLLSNDETIQKIGRGYEIQLLARYETISGHQKNTFKVLKHFYKRGCSFGKDIERTLDINRATAHRVIEKLERAGFIELLTITDIPRKAGVKTSLYGCLDVTKEEIDKAVSRDLQYSSKSYKHVEKLYQRTLPEIDRETIQYSKIVFLAKRQGGLQGFHFIAIADQVARKHQMQGVKVWR